MNPRLIVLSGLPGSGKSTIAARLADRLRAPVIAVDPIEAAMWRSGLPRSFETGVASYEVGAVMAEQHLAAGLDVVADAVNAVEVARTMWREVAQRTTATLLPIEVVCASDALHRERLERRQRGIDGLTEPTWDDVLERRRTWETWTDMRLLLDSTRPVDLNVRTVLSCLDG